MSVERSSVQKGGCCCEVALQALSVVPTAPFDDAAHDGQGI